MIAHRQNIMAVWALAFVTAMPAAAQDTTTQDSTVQENGQTDPLAASSHVAGAAIDKLKAKLVAKAEGKIQDLLQNIDIPGLKLDLKTFDTDQNGTSYGMAYAYSLQRKNAVDLTKVQPGSWYNDWAFSLSAKGEIAFEKDVNPKGFLDTSLSFHGIASHSSGALSTLQEMTADQAIALTSQAADCTTESIRAGNCKAFDAVTDIMERSLGLLTVAQYGVDASFESDQEFDATQFAFGAFAAVKLFDARDDSTLGMLNVADYPFALIRNLTGRSRCDAGKTICFKPSGRSFPTVRAALDRVMPDAQSPRSLAGDTSDYWRMNFEAAFNTPVAYWKGVDVYFTASYRYYKELSPSATVKAMGLDDSQLLTLTVGGRDGLFVSYSKGELPFGITSDETFELGWRFHF